MNKKDTEQKEPGLDSKREEFFEIFFRKGAEFANELLDELESLRHETEKLKKENIQLRHHLKSDDAIRDLLIKIDYLEEEKRSLSEDIKTTTMRSQDFVGRYEEVEQELDTMANLYVALYQLHSTLAPQEVLGVIEQLLAQFIGAGSFVIYLRAGEGKDKVLKPVHAYHSDAAGGTSIPWGEGPIGEAASTKVHSVTDPGVWKPNEPLACIPMVLMDETIGVIVIFSFFDQKTEFVNIDFEFFKLLAIHSASAIMGSGLMAAATDTNSGLKSYQNL